MRMKGYLTIEATYIFVITTWIVVSLIRFDFSIHDNLLNDACKVLGGIRYYQASNFYYKGNSIRETDIANSPVIGDDRDFVVNACSGIESDVEKYYEEKRLGWDENLSTTPISKVITVGDNANLVRSGGEIVKLIGGINDGN